MVVMRIATGEVATAAETVGCGDLRATVDRETVKMQAREIFLRAMPAAFEAPKITLEAGKGSLSGRSGQSKRVAL